MEDPVGAQVIAGRPAILAFYQHATSLGARLEVAAPPRGSHGDAAACCSVYGPCPHRRAPRRVDVTDVMTSRRWPHPQHARPPGAGRPALRLGRVPPGPAPPRGCGHHARTRPCQCVAAHPGAWRALRHAGRGGAHHRYDAWRHLRAFPVLRAELLGHCWRAPRLISRCGWRAAARIAPGHLERLLAALLHRR
ncbi:hypothetical protein ACTMU2_05860 [Cupriavidus basilensis]